jgi:uncharacterized protein YndB with AHSA1/START domain
MSIHGEPKPVRHEVVVDAPADRAFEHFTARLAAWWPSEYTWAGDTLETIAIEPREGGHCFERGPIDFQCDWGRVLVWEAPHRLVFSWQISPERAPQPDPDKASEVEVRFVEAGYASTRVELEHRGFGRHGDRSSDYRDGMASDHGWPAILTRYEESMNG